MLSPYLVFVLCWLPFLGNAAVVTPSDVVLRTSKRPGMTDDEAVHEVRRALDTARLHSRGQTYAMPETAISKSLAGAPLFQYGVNSLAITCTNCYINGSVSGEVAFTGGNYNFSEASDVISSDIQTIFDAAQNEVTEWAKDAGKETLTKIEDWDHDIEIPPFPTLDLDFNLDNITALPDAHGSFKFHDLDFYLDLDIKLHAGATYTLPLFVSNTPVGISVPHLGLGALFNIDLTLIADAEIEFGGGVHVKFDDDIEFNLAMFKKDMSSLVLPDGQYEFLPAKVKGEGSLQAIVSLKASFGVNAYDSVIGPNSLSLSAGASTQAFAYIADFTAKIGGATSNADSDCEFEAALDYTFAVGAAAGATAAVYPLAQWGPWPNTTIPVWYTNLASTCVEAKTTSTGSSQVTPRAVLDERGDSLSAATVSTSEVYTIVECLSSGLVNCPVSLQKTSSHSTTITSVISVSSGADASFPTTTWASVTSTVAFGSNVQKFAATSGSPTSYVPSATGSKDSGDSKSGVDGTTNGVSNKVIIGLTVGLGAPFIIGVIAGAWFCMRRRSAGKA